MASQKERKVLYDLAELPRLPIKSIDELDYIVLKDRSMNDRLFHGHRRITLKELATVVYDISLPNLKKEIDQGLSEIDLEDIEIIDSHISLIELVNNSLEFTGVGNGFTGSIDLSDLSSLAQSVDNGLIINAVDDQIEIGGNLIRNTTIANLDSHLFGISYTATHQPATYAIPARFTGMDKNANFIANTSSWMNIGSNVKGNVIVGSRITYNNSAFSGADSSLISGWNIQVTGDRLLVSGEGHRIYNSGVTAGGGFCQAYGFRDIVIGSDLKALGDNSLYNFSPGIWNRTVFGTFVTTDNSRHNFTGGMGYLFNSKRVTSSGEGNFTWTTNNSSQIEGHGNHAHYSVILGGVNHDIPATSLRSAIIAGDSIKVPANKPDTVFMPKLYLEQGMNASLPAGSGTDDLLVIDSLGEVKKITQASLGGGGGGTTDYVSNVSLSGTDLTFTGVGSAFNAGVDLVSLVTVPGGNNGQVQINNLGSFGGSHLVVENGLSPRFKWGIATSTNASHSTAWGIGSMAQGSTSTSFGDGTLASGWKSTAWGHNSESSGESSTSFGKNTIASGQRSTAWGYSTSATQFNSTCFGNSSLASGFSSTAWGTNTIASGNNSTAWGYYTTVSSHGSTIWGSNNTINSGADYSTIAGGVNITATQSHTVYTPKLVIGKGTSGSLPVHADEAAALTAGLESGTVYRNAAGDLKVKL